MKVHLRTDEQGKTHSRFTVFMNGYVAGTLCMKNKDYSDFQLGLKKASSKTSVGIHAKLKEKQLAEHKSMG